jgi:L-lactate dehydrogenase
MDLIKKNAGIVHSICDSIAEQNSSAVIVMVTNPVDVLTHITLKHLGWPREKILGSGTVLDSARFKYMLSSHCKVDARNVHAYIIGEHGDSEVPAWSMTHIAGVPIKQYCKTCNICDYEQHHQEIAERVRNSAYHIIDYKGSTFYGIGLSLVKITQAVLRDENSILTVSNLLTGEYEIKNVCLSVPCIVGSGGIKSIIKATLTENEHQALQTSADTIKKVLDQISEPKT